MATKSLSGADNSIDSGSAIARAFVAARSKATALPDYPGQVPEGMDAAYAIQDQAIGLWDDQIAGWKIGRVPPHQIEMLGAERIAGPIFKHLVWLADGAEVAAPNTPEQFRAIIAEEIRKWQKIVRGLDVGKKPAH